MSATRYDAWRFKLVAMLVFTAAVLGGVAMAVLLGEVIAGAVISSLVW